MTGFGAREVTRVPSAAGCSAATRTIPFHPHERSPQRRSVRRRREIPSGARPLKPLALGADSRRFASGQPAPCAANDPGSHWCMAAALRSGEQSLDPAGYGPFGAVAAVRGGPRQDPHLHIRGGDDHHGCAHRSPGSPGFRLTSRRSGPARPPVPPAAGGARSVIRTDPAPAVGRPWYIHGWPAAERRAVGRRVP